MVMAGSMAMIRKQFLNFRKIVLQPLLLSMDSCLTKVLTLHSSCRVLPAVKTTGLMHSTTSTSAVQDMLQPGSIITTHGIWKTGVANGQGLVETVTTQPQQLSGLMI